MMSKRNGVCLVVAGVLAAASAGVAAQQPPELGPVGPAPTQPAASQPTGPPPRMELSAKVFDFGEVWQGMPPKKEFTIKNTGEGPLTVRVSSSCGCTVPTNPQSPLEPGGTTSFTITYDARGKGEAHKTVTLATNDPTQPAVVIDVKGKVNPVFECDPADRLVFEDLEPSSPAVTKSIKLTNKYTRPVNLKLKEGQDFGRLDIKFKEITPGQEYELTAATMPPLRLGQNRATVVLDTDVPGVAPITLYVFANAQPRVFVLPFTLVVEQKETQPSEQTVSVMYRRETPVKVTDAKSDLPGFKYEALPAPPTASQQPQGTARIRVTLPAYQDVPEAGSRIEIFTDSQNPEYQKLEISVMRRQTPTTQEQVPSTRPGQLLTRPAVPMPSGQLPTTRPAPVPAPAPRPGGSAP